MGRPRCFPPGSFGSPRPYRDTSTRSSGCAATNANLQIDARSRLLPAYYLSPRTPPPAVRSGDGDDAAGDGDDVTYGRGAGTTASGASDDLRDDLRNDLRSGARRNDVAEPSSWRADPRGAVAAAGGAVVWTGGDGFDGNVLADVRRFLRRSAGGSTDRAPSPGAGESTPPPLEEWARFAALLLLPTVEVAEGASRHGGGGRRLGRRERRGLRRDFRRRTGPTARGGGAAKSPRPACGGGGGGCLDAALVPAEPRSEKSRRRSLAPPASRRPRQDLELDTPGGRRWWGSAEEAARGRSRRAEVARRAERAVRGGGAECGDIVRVRLRLRRLTRMLIRRRQDVCLGRARRVRRGRHIDDFASGTGRRRRVRPAVADRDRLGAFVARRASRRPRGGAEGAGGVRDGRRLVRGSPADGVAASFHARSRRAA